MILTGLKLYFGYVLGCFLVGLVTVILVVGFLLFVDVWSKIKRDLKRKKDSP